MTKEADSLAVIKFFVGAMAIIAGYLAWQTWRDRQIENKLQTKTADRWRRDDMREWVEKFSRNNPSLKVPPIMPTEGNNGQQIPEP